MKWIWRCKLCNELVELRWLHLVEKHRKEARSGVLDCFVEPYFVLEKVIGEDGSVIYRR